MTEKKDSTLALNKEAKEFKPKSASKHPLSPSKSLNPAAKEFNPTV
jgi:hypothetical protein